MLAEVIKGSPYAGGEVDLEAIETLVAEQVDRDPYRSELAGLLEKYRTLR